MAFGEVSSQERRYLYWTSNGLKFPRTEDQIILPRRWVAESALFQELARDPSPAGIVALAARAGEFEAQPTLEKCLAELIYERVREEVLPDAPSRLDCLFAAGDMTTAIDFAQRYIPLSFDADGFGSWSAGLPRDETWS